MFRRSVAWSLLWIVISSAEGLAQTPPRLEFRRMVAHWVDYGHADYLPFIDDARPELVQVGFYGGHFWSLAHTPQYKGYPAHFPVQGLNECGAWFEDLNGKLHKKGVKVVGHFNVEFLVGDPDSKVGPRGFFKFYRDLWDEKQLGPRPVKDPLELLERNADGTPIVSNSYAIGGMKEYWGCLNNPHWRTVLKAWVKVGIDRGVDGYISNYYYRHNCLCPHCQAGFRDYLKKRFPAADLDKQFGIKDVDKHVFTEIGGWHNPKESTLFKREMLRFSQIACKEAYDDVFVKHGRALKKDLILAQWNHLGNFNQINGDERCLLPKELWGKDEDYAWYSTGAAAVYTDFEKGDFGEGTLQARYLRGAFDNKPFTLGKYENTRMRVAIAELAANGGAPMGFYTNFKDAAARKEIVRYYQFLAKHDRLYRASRPAGEVLLLFPRSRVHEGDVDAVVAFRKLGKELLDRHVLFDVLPDDLLTPQIREHYRAVLKATDSDAKLPEGLTRIKAPVTVRASIDRTAANEALVVHLVNYAREPGAPSRGKGGADEKPLAAKGVEIDLVLPPGRKVRLIEFMSPEQTDDERILDDVETKNGVRFAVPEFLAYAVIRIVLSPKPLAKEPLKMTQAQASAFAQLALKGIQKEYPNKPSTVLNSKTDIKGPRDFHPAFYGSFDWHSSVHGHWMLVRLLRRFPDLPEKQQIRAVLAEHLTAKNLQAEADYFKQPNRQSFERMYGWAWLLKLAEELHTWDDPDAKAWSKNLKPLADLLVERYLAFLPKQTYPIRSGVHPNTAFGLMFALDYARTVDHKELRQLIEERSRAYFAKDAGIPAKWEPDGADFFSPSLMEADLMRRVLPAPEYHDWLRRFLPDLAKEEPKSLLFPATVADRSDPQIVHLDGLNLSRAWCMRSIAAALPKDDPARKVLLESALRHGDAALPHIASGDYVGEHWLASFAVYLLTMPE